MLKEKGTCCRVFIYNFKETMLGFANDMQLDRYMEPFFLKAVLPFFH